MKKIILILFALAVPFFFAVPLFSQQQTLIKGDVTHGGFAGPVLKYSKMLDQDAILVGMRGGWLIGKRLYIGGAGYGLVNEIESKTENAGTDSARSFSLGLGYGGLEMGFIVASDRLIHMTFQVLFGAGGVAHADMNDLDNIDIENLDGDAFFVMEPAVDVELNVASFFRICLGASYRWISDVDMNEFGDTDISGFSAVLTLKFGRF